MTRRWNNLHVTLTAAVGIPCPPSVTPLHTSLPLPLVMGLVTCLVRSWLAADKLGNSQRLRQNLTNLKDSLST